MKKLILLIAISCIFWKCSEEDPVTKDISDGYQNQMFRAHKHYKEDSIGNRRLETDYFETDDLITLYYIEFDSIYTKHVYNQFHPVDTVEANKHFEYVDWRSGWWNVIEDGVLSYPNHGPTSSEEAYFAFENNILVVRSWWERSDVHGEWEWNVNEFILDNRYLNEWEN